MENAFARAMAAIHTHNPTSDDVMCAREIVYKEIETGFVNIEILNPTIEAFEAFDNESDDYTYVIPNDNLMYRNAETSSGLTVQDANLLKIRASYCYPLYVPFVNRVMGIMLTNNNSDDCPGCTGTVTDINSFEYGCLENGRFPIHAQAIVRMQSPAMASAMFDSKISPGAATITNEPFYQCGNVDDHEVMETMDTFNTTIQTGYWTLSSQKQQP